jgi:hypothetical protein
MSRYYYKGLQYALTKYAANPQWFTNLLSPTLGDLAIRSGVGALVGGGLGYLTGEEHRDWLGRPTDSTHLRNALIGALLGGTTLGAAPAAAEWLGLQAAKRGKINPFTSWALRRKGILSRRIPAKATAAPEAAAVAAPAAAPEAAAVAAPAAAPEAAAVAPLINRIVSGQQLELLPELASEAVTTNRIILPPPNVTHAKGLSEFIESLGRRTAQAEAPTANRIVLVTEPAPIPVIPEAALVKHSAAPQVALWQRFFAPTTGALAARIGTGAAVGGGLGYLSGSEQRDWLGRPVGSNRGSRALMGAVLGGAALGGAPRAAEWLGRRGWQQGKTTPFTQWAQTRHAARSTLGNARQQMNEYLQRLAQQGVKGQQLDEAAAAQQQWYKQQVEKALAEHYNYRGAGMAPVPAPAPAAAQQLELPLK